MRIAVLSDIHGNLPALEAIFEDLKTYQPAGLIVAGDFVGGPHPDQTIELLQSFETKWMIIGNSDINILNYVDNQSPEAYRVAKQFALLRWGSNSISSASLAFLRGLPQQQVIALDGMDSIRVVHGSLDDPYDGYDPELEAEKFDRDLRRLQETVLVCGHTHCPWIVEKNSKLALNPGSVAGPLNGYIGAQYALLDWIDEHWSAQLRAIPYNTSRIRADFLESGLLDSAGPLARCFLLSNETGKDVSRQFLLFAYTLAEERGYLNCSIVPDEIWEEAEAEFDWNNFKNLS